ncbi:MAG: isoprenylcysteine carboxylmethyltransferase family protein [Balneolaceae bacterium]|nr:MAG: isoprenylcysteine carboxylmethyltransferase family protein [Balneolaceae bacterium]
MDQGATRMTGDFDSDTNTPEAAEKPPHFLELKIPPVGVFAVFALLFWGIDTWFPVFDVDIPFRLAIVVFLSVTSLIVGFLSIWLFYRKGTTVHAHKPHKTERLITSGPYKHTRNPMYLALSMVLIALAIYLSDLLSLMLMPGFFVYMTRFQIIPEERRMIEKFGEDYEEYAEKTPRWL